MSDFDRQRAERDFNMNPPTNAPGQGDDGWGDLFSNSSTDTSTDSFNMGVSGVDTDINSILNGQQGANGLPNQQFGIENPQGIDAQTAPRRTFGDKVGENLRMLRLQVLRVLLSILNF